MQDVRAQSINYQAQSLFIYKFTKYISWPTAKSGEFRIGVYGNSPIQDELEIMASLKKAAGGRKIVVTKISGVGEIEGLDLVYVAASKSREIKTIMDVAGALPVLVVCERGGLARKGASINFMIMENDTLRFEVNKGVLKSQQLEISSDLLKLGFEVG